MQGSGFLLLMTKSKSYQMLTTDCNTGTGISSDLSWKNFEEIYATKDLREGIGGGRGGRGSALCQASKIGFLCTM